MYPVVAIFNISLVFFSDIFPTITTCSKFFEITKLFNHPGYAFGNFLIFSNSLKNESSKIFKNLFSDVIEYMYNITKLAEEIPEYIALSKVSLGLIYKFSVSCESINCSLSESQNFCVIIFPNNKNLSSHILLKVV